MKKIITTFALFTMTLSFTSFQANPIGKGTNMPIGFIVKDKIANVDFIQTADANPIGKGTNMPIGF
jgi:hypothetical protein